VVVAAAGVLRDMGLEVEVVPVEVEVVLVVLVLHYSLLRRLYHSSYRILHVNMSKPEKQQC